MKRFSVGTLLLPLLLMLGGCDDFTGGEMGSLSVLLTDAEGDVLSAWVTIERIYLTSGMVNPTAGGEPGVELMTDPKTVDLVTLANDIEGMVEDAEVPTGHYPQLRVVVSEACIVVEGASEDEVEIYATNGFGQCGAPTGSLQAPSLSQTGIQVLFEQGGVNVTGSQQVLLLDFDVAQSFGHQTGDAGWVMTPVIRGGEIGLTSSVTVNLSLAEGSGLPQGTSLSDFIAELSTEPAGQPFADEDGDGTYSATFDHLVPDPETSYTVSVVAPAIDGYTISVDPSSADADVVSGADAVVDVTVAVQPAS